MRLFRRHRSGLSWLASLVLLVGTLAATAVPHPAQSGRQVYDAVLGWMPICAPSQAGKSSDGNTQHAPGTAHACCAFACAAAATPVALTQFFLELAVFPQSSVVEVSQTEGPAVSLRRVSGTLGSRGPPPLHA
jgi:hypothetical protein